MSITNVNSPSSLLTDEENETVFTIIGHRKQVLGNNQPLTLLLMIENPYYGIHIFFTMLTNPSSSLALIYFFLVSFNNLVRKVLLGPAPGGGIAMYRGLISRGLGPGATDVQANVPHPT